MGREQLAAGGTLLIADKLLIEAQLVTINSIARRISIIGRSRDSQKDRIRVLKLFELWKAEVEMLAPATTVSKNLLLIRMDDIGDYLLFRNQLSIYKKSGRWADHRITLLGNASWRGFFELLDSNTVDDTIWCEKDRYLEDAAYRGWVWRQLRTRGFDSAIAVSCTRPLLLDDLCVLAAAPSLRLGNRNTNVHADWNLISDAFYSDLFQAPKSFMHEFDFNAAFAEWACGNHYDGTRPLIDFNLAPVWHTNYILCFVGASIRSKRWPAHRWIQFIRKYRETGRCNIVIAGNGAAESEIAQTIQHATSVENIVGKVTLAELLSWVASAAAVVSNDTMAAHLGVSFNVPTVIIANGINYKRFADYSGAGITNVRTVYPKVVDDKRKREGDSLYAYSETVTADIASISAVTVLNGLLSLLPASR